MWKGYTGNPIELAYYCTVRLMVEEAVTVPLEAVTTT